MEEKWKWINGFEGYYMISSFGTIKSFHKDKSGKMISLKGKSGNYFTVNLRKPGKTKKSRVHVLVAESFIGEIPNGYEVHHIDNNKQNNVVTNLEILSKREHHLRTISDNPQCLSGMIFYNKYKRPKRVKQYSIRGCFIAEYMNCKEAGKATGICSRNILQVANKTPFNSKGDIRKQAGGYIWRFD